jgi:hypothetical protein
VGTEGCQYGLNHPTSQLRTFPLFPDRRLPQHWGPTVMAMGAGMEARRMQALKYSLVEAAIPISLGQWMRGLSLMIGAFIEH